jgi:hypothetical protein
VQDPPAGLGGHPRAEAVLAPAGDSFRLVGPFRHTDTFRQADRRQPSTVSYQLSAGRRKMLSVSLKRIDSDAAQSMCPTLSNLQILSVSLKRIDRMPPTGADAGGTVRGRRRGHAEG